MNYVDVSQIIRAIKADTNFSVFGQNVFDTAPLKFETVPAMSISVVSDVMFTNVSNRARVEVRLVFSSQTHSHEARTWYDKLDAFFLGDDKTFDGKNYFMIDQEDRNFFIDESGNRIILVDYYFHYLRS